MASLAGEIMIKRSDEEIFNFVADERNNYDPQVQHAELLTEGPIGVGTRFRSVSQSGSRRVEMIIEITEYERPQRFGSTTHLSSMDIHSTLTFEPTAGGTLMRWSSQIEPRGLLKLLSPLLAGIGKRLTTAIWANLKRTLEADGHSGQPH